MIRKCIAFYIDTLSAQPNLPIMTLLSIENSQGQYCKFKNIYCDDVLEIVVPILYQSLLIDYHSESN